MSTHVTRPEWLHESVWPFPIETIVVDDTKVAFTDVGEGPALLFLNAPQWSMVWRDVIGALCDQYRCVTLDPPGLGLSDRVDRTRQHLGTVRDAVVAVVDRLGLEQATLVVHDLGGLAGLAAVSLRRGVFGRLAAVNTFGWGPGGVLLPGMLAVFGSGVVLRLDVATRLLPWATSGPFGVGRVMDPRTRAAYRRGFDRKATAAMHRMFSDASTNAQIHRQAAEGLAMLEDAPALTVFGGWGDYLGFRNQWRRRLPRLTEVVVPRGLHFPMCDAPEVVASALAEWEASTRTTRTPSAPSRRPDDR